MPSAGSVGQTCVCGEAESLQSCRADPTTRSGGAGAAGADPAPRADQPDRPAAAMTGVLHDREEVAKYAAGRSDAETADPGEPIRRVTHRPDLADQLGG